MRCFDSRCISALLIRPLCVLTFLLLFLLLPPLVAAQESDKLSTGHAASWKGIDQLPDFWTGTWQGVSILYDPFSAGASYTPEIQEYVNNYVPTEDTEFANCKLPGMPFVMWITAMPMKFYPTPDSIALYIEGFAVTRFIAMDGREHSARPNPTFLGQSIGHWEGDTLVVSSIGFVDDIILQIGSVPQQGDVRAAPIMADMAESHGPNLRFVERIRLTDPDTMEIVTTIHDDTIFTKPHERTIIYKRYTGRLNEPMEWVCSDNRDYYDPETGKLYYDVEDISIDQGN